MVEGISRRGMLTSAAAGIAAVPLGSLAASAEQDGAAEFAVPPATGAITPFRLHVPEAVLRDLRRRLAATRFPERETVPDISQGARLEQVRGLARHWLNRYDWRRTEARLNAFGQYRTKIDGLGIHFLHVRSRHENATPLLLTHGWPGSVLEFADVIGPLTDPTAHGGRAEDAFHVIAPSLPGFGFSDKPTETGWNLTRIARAWTELMRRLGYGRYLAQGGDWGAGITQRMAEMGAPGLTAIHLNMAFISEPPLQGPPTPEEQAALDRFKWFAEEGSGYFEQQRTRPQTVGYALVDSPLGQASWIFEKFVDWTDSGGRPEDEFGYDKILDDITLYWLTGTGASSARIYWEAMRDPTQPSEVTVPVGYTTFPKELVPMPKVWAERVFKDKLVYFNKVARGGHFAAFEQPAIFTSELRAFARALR
ncbi:pimeloyl-ACP methyl ester carboxylesterase [Herbihabitans rhizosphaerae]|uniref:Pimeloyl-ACP methyl ester carboxylesterase n=1 Tax=Herbihabitans rhizosphaerae TaxID=1872711 RepID=A0A4Q7KYG3_9PSEU|nr:epoxide hydrolase [Herbihabitans rhizosphaerae]RZS41340.1 pimeloyl-ACP methyl ester carboxylesterase [Herbihabitans rhizosphaerae]